MSQPAGDESALAAKQQLLDEFLYGAPTEEDTPALAGKAKTHGDEEQLEALEAAGIHLVRH